MNRPVRGVYGKYLIIFMSNKCDKTEAYKLTIQNFSNEEYEQHSSGIYLHPSVKGKLDKPIYRYMQFEHLLKMLSSEKLYIANRSKFTDLTEFGYKKNVIDMFALMVYHRSRRKNKKEVQKESNRKKAISNVCVSCWTYGISQKKDDVYSTESYFMWKIYAGQGIGCCIESTVDKLLNSTIVTQNDCDVLLSDVTYLKRWRTGICQRDLFYKTLPYKEENELRLCSLSQEQYVLLNINPVKMISKVLLSPFISRGLASWIIKQFGKYYPEIPIIKSQIAEYKR